MAHYIEQKGSAFHEGSIANMELPDDGPHPLLLLASPEYGGGAVGGKQVPANMTLSLPPQHLSLPMRSLPLEEFRIGTGHRQYGIQLVGWAERGRGGTLL